MASLPLYDIKKTKIGSVDLADSVFSVEVNPFLINEAVRTQIARKHEWKTANSRTRTEVHGTRKKIYRQKGTGQARHGDKKAPIFVGGGKAHGPRPRRVIHKINKKAMRAALTSVLTLNQKEDRLFVVDKLELKKQSTKDVAVWLKTFGLKSALIVNGADDDAEKNFNLSGKNIAKIKFIRPEGVNVFDVLKFKNLVLSQKAAKKLTERLSHV